MKIVDIVATQRRTLSFEVFPPKTGDTFATVQEATEHIAALTPAYVSVTYGAAGTIDRYTTAIAQNIQERYSVPALAHLTCIASDRATIEGQIRRLHEAGIQNILALRGDRPQDAPACNDFAHAADLVRTIRASGYDFCIGGACYPEGHPESPSPAADLDYLAAKVAAGCSFLTTQMVFDNELLLRFVDKARAKGIDVPIIAGIMPVTSGVQVQRIVRLAGCYLPQSFCRLVQRFGDDPIAMKQAGIAYATAQVVDLYAAGINNVHIYTMNKPDVAAAIKANVAGIVAQ